MKEKTRNILFWVMGSLLVLSIIGHFLPGESEEYSINNFNSIEDLEENNKELQSNLNEENETELPLIEKLEIEEPEDEPELIQESEPQKEEEQIPSGCQCETDLDCGDFSTHNQAQSCYEYCLSVTGTDFHDLDRDNDNSACESLS